MKRYADFIQRRARLLLLALLAVTVFFAVYALRVRMEYIKELAEVEQLPEL